MPTIKPTISVVVDENLFEQIEDFRFSNRISSRSQAVQILIEKGLLHVIQSEKKLLKGKNKGGEK